MCIFQIIIIRFIEFILRKCSECKTQSSFCVCYRPIIDQGFRNWSIHINRCYLRCSIQMGTISYRSICYIFQSFDSFAVDSWNNANELSIKSDNFINKIFQENISFENLWTLKIRSDFFVFFTNILLKCKWYLFVDSDYSNMI